MSAWAIEETYWDVYPLIMFVSHRFRERYNGEFEEWLSEANLIFMQCYYKFDPSKGVAFNKYLTYMLNIKLTGVARDFAIHKAQAKIVWNREKDRVAPQQHLVERIWDDLSEDAKEVMQVIIDIPTDIKFTVLDRPATEPKGEKYAFCIAEFLEDTGWTLSEVLTTFREIGDLVCSELT